MKIRTNQDNLLYNSGSNSLCSLDLINNRKKHSNIPEGFSVYSMATYPDGSAHVLGGYRDVMIISAETLEVIKIFEAHSVTILSMAIPSHNNILITSSGCTSGSDLGDIKIWSLSHRKQPKFTERLLKERALKLAAEKADPQTGFTDPVTSMDFVYVKGGTFTMGDTFGDGDDYELPTHQVTVSDFYIGKYAVTQGEWQAVMGSNPSYFTDGGARCPVECVSWDDVQIFISKLNHLCGKNYRLPTEAEWEYAARSGGKSEKYSGGNDANAVAWYLKNSGYKTHPVGLKHGNGLGLFDMSGNVEEWVNDWYGSYSSASQTNPAGPLSGAYRVFRGGCWCNDVAIDVRVSRRNYNTPDDSYNLAGVGFRLASSVQSLTLSTPKNFVSPDSVSVTDADTGLA